MANEYLIQKETLDNIATQSNELVGKTEAVSPATIISDLSDVNAEVGDQADLINQISSILDNKTAGGSSGGEGVISGVCPTLTIAAENSMYLNSVCYRSNGVWKICTDVETTRECQLATLTDVDIGVPVFVLYACSWDPVIDSYTNIDILIHHESMWYLLIQCNTPDANSSITILDED